MCRLFGEQLPPEDLGGGVSEGVRGQRELGLRVGWEGSPRAQGCPDQEIQQSGVGVSGAGG